MAYDKEFIEKVGIYFETHDVPAREVGELFGVSKSNMYNWIKENGWIQNKYRALQQSASGAIDKATLNAVHQGAVDAVVGQVMELDQHTGHMDIDRAKRVAGQVVRDVLTLDELKLDASEALRGARDIAMNSTRLGDKRTWLECIKTGQEIIYGKNPDMVFLGDFSKITDVDIANMSQEELMRLAKGVENGSPK
jgi:hypothetical protein